MPAHSHALRAVPSAVLLTWAVPAVAQQVPAPERNRQVLAAPLSEAYPVEALGDGTTVGGYNQSRWAEDRRALRDPTKRKDALDRLKYIPIGKDDIYLTLSGELRLRTNLTTNPDLRDAEAQRQDINRITGAADLHVGSHFRVFGELAHAGISGPNIGTPSGLLRNRLVVQQSFADATTQVAAVDLGIRYGRQTFADGPNLMVVPRDNNTIFTTFNGVRAWGRTASVRFDIFSFTPTRPGQGGTEDDLNQDGRRFSGISGGFVMPQSLFSGSKLYVDPFVWRLRNRAAVWGSLPAREVRYFYGMHIWGDIGRVNVDWTINHQGGRYNDREISAWLLLFGQSFRIGKERNAPRIGFHMDYASGGGAYGQGKLANALAPFGNNIYYSYQLYATPTNLIAVAPNLNFEVLPRFRAAVEYQFSWRDSTTDAVYRANGQPFAGTQLVDGQKIAETARAQMVWSVNRYLSLTARFEHLHAGPALTKAGYKSSDFLAGWVSYRL